MRFISTRRIWLLSFAAVSLGACKDPKQADYETPAAPAAPVPAPKQFELADFKRLAWLEGYWHGRLPDGSSSFYERYHVVDDSTITQGGYADSSFTTKGDSAVIAFRNGVVVDSAPGEIPWHATALDSIMVDFRKSNDAKNHFTWTYEKARDQWVARLFPKGGDTLPERIYIMQRVKR
jgi:hypothetical protein